MEEHSEYPELVAESKPLKKSESEARGAGPRKDSSRNRVLSGKRKPDRRKGRRPGGRS